MFRCQLRTRMNGFELDVSLEAATNEILAIVGPNGAGKTTLLRLISGLTTPTQGLIEVDGHRWTEVPTGTLLPPEGRSVGYVPQGGLLFPHLTVRENVAFGLPRRDTRAVDSWLARLELTHLADSKPMELSGGQAQLVAFARAQARSPLVLLLDEPLASVDVANRASVRRILRRELQSNHRYRILVTHDPFEAAALADRIVVLEGGRVVQDGAVAELRRRPRTPYVAELVGVNLFRGIAESGTIDLEGGSRLVSASAPDGPVLATIHPRAVAIYPDRPSGSPRNVWRARVAGIEPSLEQLRIQLEGPISLVAEVTHAGGRSFAEGDEIWVSVKASEVLAYAE